MTTEAPRLRFDLHPHQVEVYNSPARFKVIVAGRQSGKSHLMAVWLICEAMKTHSRNGLPLTVEHEVLYIAPTFQQAHNVFWPKLRKLAEPVTAKLLENPGILYLTNGRRIRLVGMDNPDAARGATASAIGFDEYADMPDRAWEEIAQPMLMITEGPAMFIGTPKGKNHFFKLYAHAEDTPGGDWESFHFTSFDNPFLSDSESDRLQRDMGSDKQRQELEAEFTAHEGVVFKREWFKESPDEPDDGGWAIAVDLAGFRPAKGTAGRDIKRLDETAIAIVKVHRRGWWVKEIRHGQWDTRETANRIIRAAKEHQTGVVGIEKGALSNAVQPYLQDFMAQYQRWVHVVPLTHGNQRKTDRIVWALQGRAEKGRIVLNPGRWAEKLISQAMDFPDPRAKDDLLDALAYIDQMAGRVSYVQYDPAQENKHPVLDPVSGW